ncbi:MAG: hypothetical protein AAF827_00035 [Cyanobacteria bacterium P01_D01_bin.6]
MTSSIKYVFNQVLTGVSNSEIKEDSYTIPGDTDAVNWLKNLRINQSLRLFPNFYSALVSCQCNEYLVLVNHQIDASAKIPPGLQEEELNPGSWVAIIYELKLKIETTDVSLLEELLASDFASNSGGYKEVPYDFEIDEVAFSLKLAFPRIDIYKVLPNSDFTDTRSLARLTGLVLTNSKQNYLLTYETSVLEKFKTVFRKGSLKVNFENILASYSASEYKFCYLDLYRCIERVQPLLFFDNFHKHLCVGSSTSCMTLEDFCMVFQDKTSLQPKLNDTFEKLIDSVWRLFTPKYSLLSKKYLYRLRNQIVHLRPGQTNSDMPKDDHEWNQLIEDMLVLVEHIYTQHDQLMN